MIGIRGLIVLAISAIGIAATLLVTEALRADAQKSWEQDASNTAEALTGTLLNWLEESYAPISGLAVLAENSESVTESEFLNAFESLEGRATAFFLEAAAIVEPVPATEAQEWHIKYATDPDGILSPGTPLAEKRQLLEVVQVATARSGEIILSRPIESQGDGSTISPLSLGTFTQSGELVIVGLLDYGELIKGLNDLRVPVGASLRLSGRFPGRDGPGPEQEIIAGSVATPLFSVPTRTVSAGAELLISWDFDSRFPGDRLCSLPTWG